MGSEKKHGPFPTSESGRSLGGREGPTGFGSEDGFGYTGYYEREADIKAGVLEEAESCISSAETKGNFTDR